MIGGTLHVGIHRRGALAAWHLTDHQLDGEQSNTTIAFVSGLDGYNRVGVQFTDIANEYRTIPEFANNEFAQNARSLRPDTVPMPSIGRPAHASALARIILDQAAAARRHVDTNVDHLAYLFTPGDLLEFTHGGTASVRLKCRLVKIAEQQDKRVQLAALEHNPTLDALRNSVVGAPPGCIGADCDEDEDDDGDTDPGACEESRGGTGSLVAWFNGGAVYAAGTYFVHYLGGAYKLNPNGGYAVEGYDLVTRLADGSIAVLAPAPAVSNPSGGFATDAAAEEANDGQSIELALPQPLNVGIRLRSGAAYTNDGPEGPVRYDLCVNDVPPTGECEECPRGCAEGCTEGANVGN